MTDYTPDNPPPIPADALREALGRGDLDAAQALLDAHERAVRQALPEQDAGLLDPRQAQAWMKLVSQQQAISAELEALRNKTGEQLRQLQQHRRGAAAYMKAMR